MASGGGMPDGSEEIGGGEAVFGQAARPHASFSCRLASRQAASQRPGRVAAIQVRVGCPVTAGRPTVKGRGGPGGCQSRPGPCGVGLVDKELIKMGRGRRPASAGLGILVERKECRGSPMALPNPKAKAARGLSPTQGQAPPGLVSNQAPAPRSTLHFVPTPCACTISSACT